MTRFDELLAKKINAQKQKGLYRSLTVAAPGLIDFTSNDYLGLARSVELQQSINAQVTMLDHLYNGSTGSRLLSGNSSLITEVESRLASIFQCEATLVFNSGYAANLAVLSCLPQRNDTIIYDEYAHACIKDGARLSMARRMSFKHSDLQDLKKKLEHGSGQIFVAVEAIYSMDGDECPLIDVLALCEEYHATLILDEAHSTGVMGKDGSGMAVAQGLEKRVGVRIHTFGKAMGIHGACVAGSEVLQQYLINFARTFIYTTAPDFHSVFAMRESFEYLIRNLALQTDLQRKISHFINAMGNDVNLKASTSSIQGFIIPGNDNVRNAASILQKKGLDVRPILSPTVPVGFERLRLCLHCFNTNEEIELLASELKLLPRATVVA